MVNILVAGDYSPRDRVAKAIEKGEILPFFSAIKSIVSNVDYSIVNFESVVVDGDAKPIEKYGPNLKCTSEAVSVLSEAGFQCLTLANNHFRDFGDDGVRTSLREFKENGLDFVGGGENIAVAETTLYKNFKDGTLAIINVCENEFSIANQSRAGSAPLDVVRVCRHIIEARMRANYVLVIVHGGHEHYQLPSPRMRELYRFFVEVGADVVINHHQHCYSGYEYYRGKPIIYGLGNFLFDHPNKRNSIWNEGYMVKLSLTSSNVSFETIPYVQCNEEPVVRLMSEKEKRKFENYIEHLNAVIADDNKLKIEMDLFVKNAKQAVLGVFTPYMNEYVRVAASRHWIPYLLPKRKALAMINYISCESQRDVTLGFFENYTRLNT